MKINFELPEKFTFDLVEIDENLPSYKFEFKFDAINFNNSILYKLSLWITRENLENFFKSILEEDKDSILEDIEEKFKLLINKNKKYTTLTLTIINENLKGSLIKIKFEKNIDKEYLFKIKNEFSEFIIFL